MTELDLIISNLINGSIQQTEWGPGQNFEAHHEGDLQIWGRVTVVTVTERLF